MIIKLALLLLVCIAVFAVSRRWSRLPKPPAPDGRIQPARKCAACGAYILGSRPEACARPDCPQRGAA